MMVMVMKGEKMKRKRKKMQRLVQKRKKRPGSQPWRSRGWRGRYWAAGGGAQPGKQPHWPSLVLAPAQKSKSQGTGGGEGPFIHKCRPCVPRSPE